MANHASHAALPYPIRGARYTLLLPYLDADGDPTDPTTPDTEYSLDDGAAADTTEEVSSPKNSVGMLTLTGAETNGSCVSVAAKAASGPKTTLATLYPRVLPVVASGTSLDAGSSSGGTIASGDRPAYDVTGCFVVTTGGTGGGGTGGANNQARRIVTYAPSTGAFTVSPNFETAIDTTTDWEIRLPEGVTLGMLRALNPSTPGRTLDADASGRVDVAKVAGTAQTARDLGAGVLVADKTGFSLSAAGVQAIWDALSSALTTAGSIGKRIVDYLTGDAYARLGAPAGASISADVAALNALLSSGSYGLSAIKDAIVNVTGNTWSSCGLPKVLERPDAGSKTYRILLYLFDEAGSFDDPDSAPTVTAQNDQGTDRSANLSVVTKIATGKYRVDYTVANDHAIEAVSLIWAWTNGGKAQGLPASTAVVESTAETFTAADRAKLDTLHDTRLTSGRAAALDEITAGRLSELDADNVPADLDTLKTRIPGTVQPQTGDAYARLGSPAGASIAADIAAVLSSIGQCATPAQVATEIADALRSDSGTELSAPPAKDAPIGQQIQWLFQAVRNGGTQTATARTTRNDAGSTTGTQTISDDGSALTVGKAS